jgi:DNA-binding NarL/FixJ family response regulator
MKKERQKMYTEREKEIMFYLNKGLENSAISAELGISKHTLKSHIMSIVRKMKKSKSTLEK